MKWIPFDKAWFSFAYFSFVLVLQSLSELLFLSRFSGKRLRAGCFVLFYSFCFATIWINCTTNSFFLNMAAMLLAIVCTSRFAFGNGWISSAVFAVLLTEITWLGTGICNALISILAPVIVGNLDFNGVMIATNLVPGIVSVVIQTASYMLIEKKFSLSVNRQERYMLLMLIPFLLILLLVEYISDSVYGNTIVMDERGVILGINHGQMLLLLVLALGSLFSVLWAFKAWSESFEMRHRLGLMQQEARLQKVYVRKAQERYEKTRAFRHDCKNLLTVLRGLLDSGRTQQAKEFLGQLEALTADMSFSYATGNPVLDILFSDKLEMAHEKGVRDTCTLRLPSPCPVSDTDLCILFANALDNAVRACLDAEEPEKRFIRLYSERQGDFWMAGIENGCGGTEEEPVRFGTGLSNISMVAGKYGGAVSADREKGIFRLHILLNIS